MHAIVDQFSDNSKDRVAAAQAKQHEPAPQPAVQPAPAQQLAPAPQPTPESSTDWLAIGALATGGPALVVGGAFVYDARSIDDDANHSASQQQVN